MPMPSPLTAQEWTDLAMALRIPMASSTGATFISVLNGWQNITAVKISGNNDDTQSAWSQMISYVQSLASEQIAPLQELLLKWHVVAYGDQVTMQDGGVDAAISGASYSTMAQMEHYASMIKMLVPIFLPGDTIGPPPIRTVGLGINR